MKEQWAYLALSFDDPQQVVSRIRHSGNINRYTSAVEWVFDQASSWEARCLRLS